MRLALDLTCVAAQRSLVGGREPDPVEVAMIGVRAGVDAIGVNMKSDRNQMGERDCLMLRDVVRAPLWLKISTSPELVKFAVSLKPATVVLLPERREELPLDDGLDVILNQSQVRKAQSMLREAGIEIVAFINPTLDQVRFCHKIDVPAVQLNTLKYAESDREEDAVAIQECARLARKLGMRVSAGRGLGLRHLGRIAVMPDVEMVHVGRLFLAHATISGAAGAVAGLLNVIDRPPREHGGS